MSAGESDQCLIVPLDVQLMPLRIPTVTVALENGQPFAIVEGQVGGFRVYGFVWWFLGPLTLMPLGLGMGIQWSAASVSATLPSLTWHLVFGGVLGVSYVALNRESLAFLRGRS